MKEFDRPYSLARHLRWLIKMDEPYLDESSSFGTKRKRQLRKKIDENKALLKEVNEYIRSLRQSH